MSQPAEQEVELRPGPEKPNAPKPRPRPWEDRLIDLQADIGRQQVEAIREMRTDICDRLDTLSGEVRDLRKDTQETRQEVSELKITPALLRFVVVVLVLGLGLVGVMTGADVAIKTGLIEFRAERPQTP
jgi:hypothetical protein